MGRLSNISIRVDFSKIIPEHNRLHTIIRSTHLRFSSLIELNGISIEIERNLNANRKEIE